MIRVIAIDPGPESSAALMWDGQKINQCSTLFARNGVILAWLRAKGGSPLAIEMIQHYGKGMPAGKEVFDTCVWIGRFMEAYGAEWVSLIHRPTIKTHLCGTPKARDANVRQAIIDRFGGKQKAIGKKASPGPLYGIHSHLWSALACALVFSDLQRG